MFIWYIDIAEFKIEEYIFKKNKTVILTQTGLYAAIIFIASQFIKIPLPFGYANLGDCFVIMSGWYIGGIYGCAGAALSIPGNALQGIAAIIICNALFPFAVAKQNIYKK